MKESTQTPINCGLEGLIKIVHCCLFPKFQTMHKVFHTPIDGKEHIVWEPHEVSTMLLTFYEHF